MALACSLPGNAGASGFAVTAAVSASGEVPDFTFARASFTLQPTSGDAELGWAGVQTDGAQPM